ncbi:MAG: YggS family pyridoxal phosphate-dependent enzyme [Polyangiaceae bacterium]|nr:YggS family pyridoxal phosphate-dependent enzyme [Polyangiaceae bacterium]
MDRSPIPDALERVRGEVHAAARAAGRAPESVRIVAVSKLQGPEAVRAAFAAGQRDFGETYAQELGRTADALEALAGLRWHFIGHLQRNKVKEVAPRAAVVHTVDRAELALELERRAAVLGRRLEVLVQVNVAGEAQKSGCRPAELGAVLEAVARAPHLAAVGLMTMPPLEHDAARNRPCFAALRELRDRHGGARLLPELSMGMSGDFAVAIAEGATIVRIGTAIFGARGG